MRPPCLGGRYRSIQYQAASWDRPRRVIAKDKHHLGSLTSLPQRLFKTGGRLIRHTRYFVLRLAESYLTQRLFRRIVTRIERLAWHPT